MIINRPIHIIPILPTIEIGKERVNLEIENVANTTIEDVDNLKDNPLDVEISSPESYFGGDR